MRNIKFSRKKKNPLDDEAVFMNDNCPGDDEDNLSEFIAPEIAALYDKNDDGAAGKENIPEPEAVVPEEAEEEKAPPSPEEIVRLKSILEAGRAELSADLDFEEAVKKDQEKTLLSKKFIKGDSKPLLVFTVINGIMYALWTVLYIACTIMRYAAFNIAQNDPEISNYPVYSLEIHSPLFPVLKFFAILFPVILIVWTAVMAAADKKKKVLPDKRLIIAVMIIDIICAVTAAVDIIMLHMIFV